MKHLPKPDPGMAWIPFWEAHEDSRPMLMEEVELCVTSLDELYDLYGEFLPRGVFWNGSEWVFPARQPQDGFIQVQEAVAGIRRPLRDDESMTLRVVG